MWISNFVVATLSIKNNGQACPYVVPPGICLPLTNLKSSFARLRTKTFYTPSYRPCFNLLLDSTVWMKLSSSFQEMANCCRQNSKIYFNACNKTDDKSQQSCKKNIVVRHFELESLGRIAFREIVKRYMVSLSHLNNVTWRTQALYFSESPLYFPLVIGKLQMSYSSVHFHQAFFSVVLAQFWRQFGASRKRCMIYNKLALIYKPMDYWAFWQKFATLIPKNTRDLFSKINPVLIHDLLSYCDKHLNQRDRLQIYITRKYC